MPADGAGVDILEAWWEALCMLPACTVLWWSRENDVGLLLCCTKSLKPCGRCPSLDEVGESGIVGSILSVDISVLSILVAPMMAVVVALAEPSCIKRRYGAEVGWPDMPLEPQAPREEAERLEGNEARWRSDLNG